mmetsp:Transcript_23269/g.58850  ORF Transcript_23269/g.58850 Transcript_23269/m.58850 type:complete len:435 (+) Transcript_23269:1447-2751(+)
MRAKLLDFPDDEVLVGLAFRLAEEHAGSRGLRLVERVRGMLAACRAGTKGLWERVRAAGGGRASSITAETLLRGRRQTRRRAATVRAAAAAMCRRCSVRAGLRRNAQGRQAALPLLPSDGGEKRVGFHRCHFLQVHLQSFRGIQELKDPRSVAHFCCRKQEHCPHISSHLEHLPLHEQKRFRLRLEVQPIPVLEPLALVCAVVSIFHIGFRRRVGVLLLRYSTHTSCTRMQMLILRSASCYAVCAMPMIFRHRPAACQRRGQLRVGGHGGFFRSLQRGLRTQRQRLVTHRIAISSGSCSRSSTVSCRGRTPAFLQVWGAGGHRIMSAALGRKPSCAGAEARCLRSVEGACYVGPRGGLVLSGTRSCVRDLELEFVGRHFEEAVGKRLHLRDVPQLEGFRLDTVCTGGVKKYHTEEKEERRVAEMAPDHGQIEEK